MDQGPTLVSVNASIGSKELGVEVAIRLRQLDGRWLAVAQFGGDPEVGIGALYIHPRTVTVERTLGAVMTEGRPPTPAEGQTLARATGESRRAGRFVLAGLAIAVLSMATARYWGVVI